MKSQCWGREAKPCLSECSGCCSLLKCQVLVKNNTPHPLTLLPLAPCLPTLLPHPLRTSRLKPLLEQRLRNEPFAWLCQRGKLQRFCCLQKFIYLFIIFYFFSASPLWPLRWRQQGWWNVTISLFFLFSLSSRRHTSSLDSFHFIPCLSWLFPWFGACS